MPTQLSTPRGFKNFGRTPNGSRHQLLEIKESNEAGSKDYSNSETQVNKVLLESEAEDFQVPVTPK